MPKRLKEGQSQWISTLLDPKTQVTVSLVGCPGYFRVPPGWDNKRDGLASEHLIHFVAHGSFQASVGAKHFRMESNSFLCVSPKTVFRFRLLKARRTIVYRFRLETTRKGTPLSFPHPFLIAHRAPLCRLWCEQIIRDANATDDMSQSRIRGLLVCLYTEVFRKLESTEYEGKFFSRDQRIQLSQLLIERPGFEITPKHLADFLHLSPDYFTRVFRRTYQKTPRKWIAEERIRLAGLRLIESDLPISTIAEEFGYKDIFFFSRQFKEITGQSPSLFRVNHHN